MNPWSSSQLLVFLLCFVSVHTKDIFHGSGAEIQSILDVQKGISRALETYMKSLERRMELSKRFLEDIQDYGVHHNRVNENNQGNRSVIDSAMKNDEISKVIENPLEMFKLMRRFASTFPQLERELHQDHERKFLRSLESSKKGVILPQQGDLDSAIQGLIRVQDAYDLDVFSFANGDFIGLTTNSSLNAADCFLVGSYALSANIFTRAIEWLERCFYLIEDELDLSISRQIAWKKLQEAVSRHNAALQHQSLYVFENRLDVQNFRGRQKASNFPRRRKRLDNSKSSHKLYMKEPSLSDLTNFAALCRGEQVLGNKVLKTLKCWLYRGSPITLLDPLKIEILHEREPKVMQIHNIISDSLSDRIISEAKQSSSLSRSRVHDKKEMHKKIVSASRTSASTWIHDHNLLRKVKKNVYARLEKFLSLHLMGPEALEDLQVSSYNTCGHYNPHLDTIMSSQIAQDSMDENELNKGDRLATLMFYLSEVQLGGYSAFPRIGIAAKPVKGSALVWFNFNNTGESEPWSLHGGCPVLYGNKWIANQWIRANSQMFSRKCPLV